MPPFPMDLRKPPYEAPALWRGAGGEGMQKKFLVLLPRLGAKYNREQMGLGSELLALILEVTNK